MPTATTTTAPIRLCQRKATHGMPNATDAQRIAQTYIQPDRMAVVIVGDRKIIEQGSVP